MSEQRPSRDASDTVLSEPASRPGSRGGPYLLLVPLVFAVAAIWWVRHPGVSLVPTRPPERVDPETTHEVLGGELAIAGAALVFWLSPCEPDPERQVFQTNALRRRYGLAEGEPWRLRLEWRPVDKASSSDATLDLSRVAIDDDSGRALAPLRLERELDPLATLLQPPAQPLRIGTSLDLVLWGRAPGAAARLLGVERTSTAGERPFEAALSSRPLRIGDLIGPMARVDPSSVNPNSKPEGKTPSPGASALPVRGADGARY